MTLDPDDLKAISDLIDLKIGVRIKAEPVMDWRSAAEYVSKKSYRAFRRWCRAWHVPSCGHGRWSKSKLDMGQDREARGIREHRKAA